MLHNTSSEFICLILFDHLLISPILQPLSTIILLFLNSTSLFFFYPHCLAFLKVPHISGLSVSKSCLFETPWTAAHQTSLSLTVSWSLPKFISIASVTPFSHLILWCPLLLLPSVLPSIRDFSNESAVRIRWPKYWSFNFSISPSKEYSGLVSLRIDWISWLSKGLLRVFFSTTIWKHQFFGT